MDSDNNVSLVCAVSADWLNEQGVSVRRVAHKAATLRLVRNELRDMFVELSTEKTRPIKLRLAGIVVHKKFMAEGKASIKFGTEKCMLMLSNAPPGTLMLFLKTLFVKMTGDRAPAAGGGGRTAESNVNRDSTAAMQKNIRAHMMSGAPSKFEDVSPVTLAEVSRAQRMAGGSSRGSTTTPSPMARKRRLDDTDENNGATVDRRPAAKKLYTGNQDASPVAADNTSPTQALNDEQQNVFKACVGGKNVFFTGSAGTGKSFLLKKIISSLPPDGTVATASTGVAACLIGGVTLHSFAGIGNGDGTLKRCYDLASRPMAAQVWRRCKTLVIDEVSMVDGEFFDKLESVARYIRRNDRPFGGIQLILCGDFLQLPPVTKSFENSNRDFNPAPASNAVTKRFCFQSEAWSRVIGISYELKIVHRQKDLEFVRILNLLRIGHVNEEVTKRLLDTAKQTIESDGILATQLCSHAADAAAINETKLRRLDGETRVFNATDSDASAAKQLDGQVPAPARLELKVGAQVMLLKNINVAEGLVNGARGVVVRYDSNVPVVHFKRGREYVAKPEKWMIRTPAGGLLVRRQVPLKLAWAFSIHKSQGLTLDCVEMSLSKVFEAGQAYVALSRVQNLQSLRVLDFDSKQVWANTDVLQFYKMFRRNLHDQTMVPLGRKKADAGKRAMLTGGSGVAGKLSKGIMDKPLMNIC